MEVIGKIAVVILAALVLTEGVLWHKSLKKTKDKREAPEKSKPEKSELPPLKPFDRSMNPLPENVDWNEVNDILETHCLDKYNPVVAVHSILYDGYGVRMSRTTSDTLCCLYYDIMRFYSRMHAYGVNENIVMLEFLREKYRVSEKYLKTVSSDYEADYVGSFVL